MTLRQQLRAWKPSLAPNPLPEPFEGQALRVFSAHHPIAAWADPLFKGERDAARAVVQKNALDTIESMTWTLDTALDLLTEQSIGLLFGEREIGPALRKEVRDYSESFLEDLGPVIGYPAMSPAGQAKNAADLQAMPARKVG